MIQNVEEVFWKNATKLRDKKEELPQNNSGGPAHEQVMATEHPFSLGTIRFSPLNSRMDAHVEVMLHKLETYGDEKSQYAVASVTIPPGTRFLREG